MAQERRLAPRWPAPTCPGPGRPPQTGVVAPELHTRSVASACRLSVRTSLRALARRMAIDEGGPCIHCGSTMSSMWRTNSAGQQVCRTNDCWREEEWLGPKKQRGRPPAGGRATQPTELNLQSYIFSITKVEGQRCATPSACTCTRHRPACAPDIASTLRPGDSGGTPPLVYIY